MQLKIVCKMSPILFWTQQYILQNTQGGSTFPDGESLWLDIN